IDDQERPENSTQDVNTAGPSINTEPYMFSLGDNATLEATHADFFGDKTEVNMINITTTYLVPSTPNTRIHKDHSLDHVIGDVQSGVQTRRMTKTTNKQGFISAIYEGKTHKDLYTSLFACFLSQEEPKRITKTLMDLPKGKRAIGTKWVFRNKKDERGIDYDEVFAPVARIQTIRLIKEEVYVCQPLGFEDPDYPDKVYKVVKSLYGLHQAPRAWYETLAKYLLDNGFYRGKIDQTLFIKKQKGDILLVQVYVDDIIFGSTKREVTSEEKEDGIFISQDKYVADIMRKFSFIDVRTASTLMDTKKPLLKDSNSDDVDVHLYMSMIGSLMYLTSSRPDVMFAVCACARLQVTPKVSHLHAVKRIFRYLKGQPKLDLWYPRDSSFDLVAYSDSDYARASLDRKSTTGGCPFLECRLISWQCKKQTVVATSSTEAEYVAAASCYRQESVVPQPRSPTQTLVADKATSTGVDVRYGGATTTITGLEARQGSGNIDKTPTMPHDSPLLRFNTLGSDEGSMTLQELMLFCTTLLKKVESLETDLKQTKQIYGVAYTRLIKKGRYGHDMEFNFEFDATKEVSTNEINVSAVKPVSTAGAAVTNASVATLVYIKKGASKDKSKGKMAESKIVQPKTTLQREQERLDFETAMRLKMEMRKKKRMAERLESQIVKGLQKKNLIAGSSKMQKIPMKAQNLLKNPGDKEAVLGSTRRSSKLEIIIREANRHLHASREGVSIVKGNSYIDVGRKALGGSR
ncbi:putative ribonuclease H-like domain-containing protein, partial [Tanacetum coccineum]